MGKCESERYCDTVTGVNVVAISGSCTCNANTCIAKYTQKATTNSQTWKSIVLTGRGSALYNHTSPFHVTLYSHPFLTQTQTFLFVNLIIK